MNMILLFADDFITGSQVVLRGRRLTHLREVHRAAVGDYLRVGMLDGLLGRARLCELDTAQARLEVVLDTPPPPPSPITLVLALPRPKTLKKVVPCAAALGIRTIFIIRSWRVEKSYWTTPLLQPEALRELCVSGLEQGCDTVLPTIHLRPLFKPFVQDELPGRAAHTTALTAHPRVPAPCPCQVAGPITLAIGPEGGFIDSEISMLEAAGLSTVNLGRRILRVEDALPCLAGRLTPY